MKVLPLAALVLIGFVQAGASDETPVASDFTQMDWVLTTVDGQPAGYSATLNLREPGRVKGQAPCNRYFADLTRDGENFTLGAIGATRMACLQIKGEADFFQALQRVKTASQGPGMLTLTGGGHELVFVQHID